MRSLTLLLLLLLLLLPPQMEHPPATQQPLHLNQGLRQRTSTQ